MKRYKPKDGEDEFQITMTISFANYLFLINRPKYIDFKKCRDINIAPLRRENQNDTERFRYELETNL